VAVSCSECTVKESGLTSLKYKAQKVVRAVIACSETRYLFRIIQNDSELLSVIPWSIYGNPTII
jgi:hypothetical protein